MRKEGGREGRERRRREGRRREIKDIDFILLQTLNHSFLPSAPLPTQVCSVVRLEVKGLQNNIRVRQLQVLAPPTRRPDAALTSVSAQQKACEEEALRVFRLLTSQVHITGSFKSFNILYCYF